MEKTMNNAQWCVKNNIKFKEIHVPYDVKAKEAKIVYRGKEIGRSKICGTSFEALKEWLDAEHREQILDDVERMYLKGVIRPFRDRVEYIKKIDSAYGECIYIQLNGDWVIFPHFRTGTMYKSMKLGYEYSLEELGL